MVRHEVSPATVCDSGAIAEGVWEYVNQLVKTYYNQDSQFQMASLPISRGTSSSSDTEESEETDTAIVNYGVLQELNQEDVAAILDDPQEELDNFTVFDKNISTNQIQPQQQKESFPDASSMIIAEDGSGSDMELPHQAVNALIQRTTESESENDSQDVPPSSLYSNSLLQQFEVQTQMLNTSSVPPTVEGLIRGSNANSENQNNKEGDKEQVKRKRGRPRKVAVVQNNQKNNNNKVDFSGDPNVSPDSGIQNSPDHVSSPEASPLPKNKFEKKVNAKKDEKLKELKEQSKLPVTCNKFDRLLYGHVDRVLYPQRRKVGRPPIVHKKGPGRPPKHKNVDDKKLPLKQDKNKKKNVLKVKDNQKEIVKDKNKTEKIKQICEKVYKRIEQSKLKPEKSKKLKSKNKLSVVSSKAKADIRKFCPVKVMHSRHKHKKHKKCRFKILKPITTTPDPKINTEIEKLVIDFMRMCNISPKSKVENPDVLIKALKKASKKRKASEYSERKKKKLTTLNSENNQDQAIDQRLPLKKRHYKLIAENNTEKEEDLDKKMKENKLPQNNSKNVEKNVEKKDLKTPNNNNNNNKGNASPQDVTNNNEYEVETHIDEAIEACINKYSKDGKIQESSPSEKEEKNIPVGPITTPKKRHLLEIANNQEIALLNTAKNNLIDILKTDDLKKSKSLENVVSEIKMKISPKLNDPKKDAQMITRKKNRLEDLTSNLVSKINPKETPIDIKPGVFTPTVDLELETHLEETPAESVQSNEQKTDVKENDSQEELKREPPAIKRKIRKRRAINRTGFPTVKKKKKKLETPPTPCVVEEIIEEPPKLITSIDDRVPKDGEEYSSFLQRTTCQVSVIPLEKLQQVIQQDEESENILKWESVSECDSLPQDERIEFDELKNERKRDISPCSSVDTRTSGGQVSKKRKESAVVSKSDDEESLESRLKRLEKKGLRNLYRRTSERRLKRKLREVSPASSVEPSIEKRLRDERGSASGDDKKHKKVPRWRKKSLVAGLFSDYYKEDDETARLKRTESSTTKTRLVYNPEEHPYGLLPAPYHCGKYLRCRKIPFQLPYDLWWQHTHSQLPGRDIVPSWNYRKIRTNVYNVKLPMGACEPQSCNCTPVSGCGDDCINRLVLAECPASHKCQNQRIQRHEWAPGLEKFMTENKGWGVKTNLAIKRGEFILEYVGEVVSDQEFKERMATRYVNDTHHYCLHLDGGMVIDGHRMGGDGRFVNHSCAPNCEIQKWSVNGQFRMALFSLRNVEAGEELTYDYNFSLFNPADGQECRCGSDICRGVIGGKSQRVRQPTAQPVVSSGPGRVGRPRKNQAKKAQSGLKEVPVPHPVPIPVMAQPPMKPLTNGQKAFILQHHCFLLRNLYKPRRGKGTTQPITPRTLTATPTETATITTNGTSTSSNFANHMNALRQKRNIKTRRLAQVEDNPELQKTAKLARFLQDLFNIISKAKDEKNEILCAPFLSLPSKRKVADYYQKILDPIDLTTIEQNIGSGVYKTAENFDIDMGRLFANAIKYYGRTSEIGIAATRLKKIYVESKHQNVTKFVNEVGEKPPVNFIRGKNKSEEEDVIRCICGMYRDEGLMIQCERCLVWQHCECVKADVQAPSYHCERCVPRKVDYEIPTDEFTEHGHRYYMTLLRGDLQLRQGDTVYVLRDIPIPGTNKKHTYDTIGPIKYSDLDIFRIERLWKDSKTEQRFAYGHHYLRPHETYHEPTRKFFPNEVMRVPLYEAVPVELVMEHCWVMDLNTYCKGRPMGAPEKHIYICEYRVDKTARLFSKVSKPKFPICIKSYAFERFDTRLKVSRTYTPHDLDPAMVKPRGRKPQETEDFQQQQQRDRARSVAQISIQVPVVRTRTEQKARLNKILLILLNKLPTKQPLDVSYLLEGGRRRKKTT
ncbi:histone-lysine N-methyltransferase ash1 isoform X2 [Onthophagus taurus]|uniref:histone-lysine N-methyltransferase ash1 isoform X2 n=1 Tax=Onthophagus taurus TaxID=166361 RepID=UPI0039BEA611